MTEKPIPAELMSAATLDAWEHDAWEVFLYNEFRQAKLARTHRSNATKIISLVKEVRRLRAVENPPPDTTVPCAVCGTPVPWLGDYHPAADPTITPDDARCDAHEGFIKPP